MGRHGKRRQKGGVLILLALAVVLLGIVILIRGGMKAKDRDHENAEAEAPTALQKEIPQETPAPTRPPTPWYLVLVNRDHPVPEDWTVDPVELPNGQTVDRRIYEPLMELFEAARSVNLDILPIVESGYRTKEKQQALYDQKYAEYLQQGYSGEKAGELTEEWVSVPGTSEHQLGIAVDISGAVYAIYPWLQENAYKYGFILRYPANKTSITGVAPEEWHYRYVGVEAATEMYESGLCLEEYTASLS